LEVLELLLAQRAVNGLKRSAQQQRVLARTQLCVVEDLPCPPLHQFGNPQSCQRLVDLFPADATIQNQRKIAPHRLKARNLLRDGLAQRQLVEPVQVELA